MKEQTDSLLPYARKLRKEMTPHERKLWYLFLRTYSVKFYKQKIIGNYIVDFYCRPAKLVVELDGSQHYNDADIRYDEFRTKYLEERGLKVLRFTNTDIDRRFNSVCEKIDEVVKERMEK